MSLSSDSTPFTHSRDITLVESPDFMSGRMSPFAIGQFHPRALSTTSSRDSINSTSVPFQYADDLESASDAVLSLYLDSPGEALPDPSEVPIPYRPLLHYVKTSGLVRNFRHRVREMIMSIVRIGELLYPPTYLLHEDVARKVKLLGDWIKIYLDAVIVHLEGRVDKAFAAFCRLPSPCATNKEELALSIAKWTEILDSLHKPTNREGYIFREISAIYSSHVYQPLLQLHRNEPEHNMWQLEPQLTPISLLLREAANMADKADNSVRAIEDEFELTMFGEEEAVTPPQQGSRAFGEHKGHHTPSKSAPNVVTTVLRFQPRPREHTL